MPGVRLIVLAGQRPGVINPLAAASGVSHKCLIPIRGMPLIAHVLRTGLAHPAIGHIVVSVEADAFAAIAAIAPEVHCIASRDNLADSVATAAAGHDGPVIITTADNALLTPDALSAMVRAVSNADVAIALTRREAVLAAHPEGQRNFYRFADGHYSNCNLYAVTGPGALKAAEIFRGGGQFRKQARRVITAFGLINLILMRSGLVSLADGLARVSRRIGLNIAPVILVDGRNAIDVDNARTYDVVAELLAREAYPQSGSALAA